jgi:hypothetical protein
MPHRAPTDEGPDARFSDRSDMATVVERLLAISGEDEQTVPQKFRPDYIGQLEHVLYHSYQRTTTTGEHVRCIGLPVSCPDDDEVILW